MKATVSNIGEENNVKEVQESKFVEENIIEDFIGATDINIESRKMFENLSTQEVKQFKHPAVLVLNTKEPERPGNKECQKELNPGKIVRKNTTKLLFVLKLLFQIFALNVSQKLFAM